MVVDDDPAIGQILTVFLAKRNYASVVFTSGKEALNYLAANEVNLLLTDIEMPAAFGEPRPDISGREMSGLELARQVKRLFPPACRDARGAGRALPVIVMSGTADSRALDEIFKLGADFILGLLEQSDLQPSIVGSIRLKPNCRTIAKPFDLDDLLIKINSLMKIRGGPVFDEKRR